MSNDESAANVHFAEFRNTESTEDETAVFRAATEPYEAEEEATFKAGTRAEPSTPVVVEIPTDNGPENE